jgi:hypothetical protein
MAATEPRRQGHVYQLRVTHGTCIEVNHGGGGPGQDERFGHPRDTRPGGVECMQGAALLKVKGQGMLCGHTICSVITAVRRSRFGRLEVATTHRNGDKPEKYFRASFHGVQSNDKWPHSQTARKGWHLGGEERQDQGQVQGQVQGQGRQGHPSSPRPRIDPPLSTFFS